MAVGHLCMKSPGSQGYRPRATGDRRRATGCVHRLIPGASSACDVRATLGPVPATGAYWGVWRSVVCERGEHEGEGCGGGGYRRVRVGVRRDERGGGRPDEEEADDPDRRRLRG